MTETVEVTSVTSAAAADEETAKVEETTAETAKSPSVAPSVKAAGDLLYGALDPLAL